MRHLMKNKVHLFRMAGLFVVGFLVFAGARAVFVPEGFGVYGHYRAGALEDNRAFPLVHAGRAACAGCHGDEPEALKASRHAKVGCEACHGALAVHADDPAKLTPKKPDAKTLCLVCHMANVAKPSGFKQISPEDHPEGVCTECHDPHSPADAPKPAPAPVQKEAAK
ncbi:MAG: hypothetical protein DIJKHBIC_02356 [Thermoanaerobaculia bacterium]|nr:hypothetical protein [Thermoanaerobaculia bacterium]